MNSVERGWVQVDMGATYVCNGANTMSAGHDVFKVVKDQHVWISVKTIINH